MSKILPWIFGILIIGNLVLLDFFWIRQKTERQEAQPTPASIVVATI